MNRDEIKACDGKTIECTAWDLISGKYTDLIDMTHEIQVGRGKQRYQFAEVTRNLETVRLERLDLDRPCGLRTIRRYVSVDTHVSLVPIPGWSYKELIK